MRAAGGCGAPFKIEVKRAVKRAATARNSGAAPGAIGGSCALAIGVGKSARIRSTIRSLSRFQSLTLLCIGALLGGVFTAAADQGASPFLKLGRIVGLIEREYVLPIEPEALKDGAIRGMVESLDVHSAYYSAEDYRIFRTEIEGSFVGVGVSIGVSDGFLEVLSVFEGGPAARAGLLPGDRILTIDGRGARDLRIDEAVRRVRGEPGTKIVLSVRREGVEGDLRFEIERGRVSVPVMDEKPLPGGFLYLSLSAFPDGSAAQVERALESARERGELRGLLLDLRNNGGGLIGEAARLTNLFIRRGTIVTTRGRDGRMISEFKARGRGPYTSLPLVVLINGRSASAAEIVAAALSDHRRAKLVGTRSFGKGSVQRMIELEDGAAIKLTTALHHRPNGETIQAIGVEPDLMVPSVRSKEFAAAIVEEPSGGEALLERHLELRLERDEETAEAEASFPDDLQARIAFELLQSEAR